MNQFIFNLFYQDDELKKLLTSDEMTKVFSGGIAPLGTSSPYVTWQIISKVPTQTIGNQTKNNRSRIQFDIYSDKERQALQIQNLLNKRLERTGYVISSVGPMREPETKHYRISQDVSFITGR
ncbi:MAG: tail completion protein gp17 [Wohlfahrtiimonas sp.]